MQLYNPSMQYVPYNIAAFVRDLQHISHCTKYFITNSIQTLINYLSHVECTLEITTRGWGRERLGPIILLFYVLSSVEVDWSVYGQFHSMT